MHASEMIYQKLSALFDGRIYPIVATEHADSTTPYAVYHIVASEPLNTFDGYTGHDWVRVQIDIYHDDYDALLACVNDTTTALHPFYYLGTTYHNDGTLYRAIVEYKLWQD